MKTHMFAGCNALSRPARLYRYGSAKPCADPFGDLPPPDGLVTPKDGYSGVSIDRWGNAGRATPSLQPKP